MQLSLSENIKSFRKARRLTQEQLSEVLGVTAGAVYKWESGLSVPDLQLIIEMADFFDVSVDVLLGYQMKDNHIESVLSRITALSRNHDREALAEAEKALKKYPHSFDVVHAAAQTYNIFGIPHNREELSRALELFREALLLLPGSRNTEVSELTLWNEIAGVYNAMEDYEKAIEILKQHNTDGFNSGDIGTVLAIYLKKPDEAEPYLVEYLVRSVSGLVDASISLVSVFSARGDYHSALEIILWGKELLSGLKKTGVPGILDKTLAVYDVYLAYTHLCSEDPRSAETVLREASDISDRFDASPNYGIENIRFIKAPTSISIYDMLGSTAEESIRTILRNLDDSKLTSLWDKIREENRKDKQSS